ncbi:MAG: hypothetical protein HN802_06465 [Candidatus Jacksonbacteria bacterium]|jgi:hypothetical protein|nr:hypothetical protein [Candidatus Jacksonbacteria bacterium]
MAYCTNRELKDIFPSIDEFDTKTPIYGWVVDSGSRYKAEDCGLITQLFASGENLGSAQASSGAVDTNGEWYYTDDVCYYYNDVSNPNDLLMESGEDWSDLRTRYISNASRYLDSMLDSMLPREQFKDQDGNYDYIIVRTTALLACSFLIRASDPTSEIADALFNEANVNIASLNEGKTKLSWQTTGDASMGVIREGSVSGALRIVDTKGAYDGVYDKIGVKVTTGGAMGTAKYSYWAKDSDNLGAEKMNNGDTSSYSDTINGTYQPIGNGLYIRFAGDTADTATLNDYWEIEVSGRSEKTDLGYPRTIRMTRR